MNIFGIFRESFKTIKANRKLLLPVLVLVFLSFSQLDLTQTYLLEPVVKDFSLQLAKNPKLFEDIVNHMHEAEYAPAINDLREVLLVKLIILTLSSITFLLFLVATVSSSSEAYTAKVLNRQELLLKIKKSWKKPISTSFYMIIIIMGLFFACSLSIGIVTIIAVDSWAYLFYGVLCVSVLVLWFYVCALWIMSLVVSILENIGGLGAIGRARELMNGKKVQATKMMLLLSLTYGVVHLMKTSLLSGNLNKWSRLAISIPFDNGMLCALRILSFVAFTVFYHECKERFDEKEAKGVYDPIVADEV
nr:dual specificity protein kinase [Tanacetum cinerariifolium]